MLEKLKSFLADDALYNGLLLLLIAGASFGLGRQSVMVGDDSNTIENKAAVAAAGRPEAAPPTSANPLTPTPLKIAPESAISGQVQVVGSKTGTKYHLPECSGAKRIKPENLVTFESIEAAEAAGYTPAANCPGL